jgi:hypothetical protein
LKTRLLISIALLTCLVPYAVAQKTGSLSSQKAAAEAAWPAFFKALRAAVDRRDQAALKKMMVRDFFFSGGSDDNQDGDFRDEAFKWLADPQIGGWKAFSMTLAKGAVPSPPNPNDGGKKYLSKVAPPAARTIRSLENAPPWIASFEFRDGQWYCTSFSECCD